MHKYLLYAFLLVLTIAVYLGAVWLFKRSRVSLLHPLLTSSALMILFLILTDIPIEDYQVATIPLDILLGPTVVALGFALYEQVESLKKNLVSILVSVMVGAAVSILSIWGLLLCFGTTHEILVSLLPKSVTNPIAIPISVGLGGISGLTSVVVVITGIFGGIVGPGVLKLIRIKSPVAKGVAMGCASHGVGTARAMELGAIEGAMAGLSIGLMGLATALLIPLVKLFL